MSKRTALNSLFTASKPRCISSRSKRMASRNGATVFDTARAIPAIMTAAKAAAAPIT